MSTDGDKDTACPNSSEKTIAASSAASGCPKLPQDETKRQKPKRKVSFPADEDKLVTQYFEPANPWQNVSATSQEELFAAYLDSCRRHSTHPIESVVQHIQDLSNSLLNGVGRAYRLCLTECTLCGAAAVDALESLLCRVQYRRLELHDTSIDDEGAEAIFDMIEYYESANILNLTGSREFGVRGWQAFSRMIKKSAELSEIEIRDAPLEPAHAPVLARALRPHTCRLRSLCLTRASLAGEPLTCLVTVLKINNSVRELKLGDNKLTTSDAEQLAGLLRINTRLQLLDLSNNFIQDMGVCHLSEALAEQAAHSPPSAAASPLSPHTYHCPTSGYEPRGLAFLVLWNNQLTRNCAPYLNKALRTSQSLCVLNVGRNALGGEGIRALSGPGALISLGLQASRLGPDAARAIADLIRGHTTLQRLDLRDNRLGGSGLELVLTAMRDNTTLTQIDLDDDTWSASLSVESGGPGRSEAEERARLTREIRALCRNNESEPTEHRPLRKISLTCHSAACSLRSPPCEEERRGGRLRSPLPSPAGSPVPPQHSRFSVTRVTPERESSTESSSPSTPTRPSYCSTSSRFKVEHVAEKPKIQVQPAKQNQTEESRRNTSRFMVSRNYDTMYNPVGNPSSLATSKTLPSDNKYQDKSEQLTHNETLNKQGDDTVLVAETKLVKSSTEVSENESLDVKVEVTVKKESLERDSDNKTSDKVVILNKDLTAKVVTDQNTVVRDITVVDDGNSAIKNIEAITEDLNNLIQEMKDKKRKEIKTESVTVRKSDNVNKDIDFKNDSTQTECTSSNEQIGSGFVTVPVSVVRDNVVLKKNKSESSLDSPDLEVSRLMNKKHGGSAFCDSNSSLEISGSSVESLNNPDVHVSQVVVPVSSELDRRKTEAQFSTENSLDSNNSELTPTNNNFLNTSVSSNESVSPIIFGKNKKIHGSLSSLEASVSSLDSTRGNNQEKIMVTSADSGIEYSLQNPSENREDSSSNEGTLTHNFSFKEPSTREQRKDDPQNVQDTLTSSPKRTSSLLDVPTMKNKNLDRMRKISWVAPSSSFHIPKPEPEPPKPESKLPLHLEKLLSLFHNPGSIFSRSSSDDERRSASNTPPRKESTSLSSSFWSWGAGSSAEKTEKGDKVAFFEDDDSSPENATDSTLSMERVQVSFIDESFSKKLDSKTPSTDTDNTLSEFQSLPTQCVSETSDLSQQEFLDAEKSEDSKPIETCEDVNEKRVTAAATVSTENNIVQKQLDLSLKNTESTAGPQQATAKCDIAKEDLIGKYENPNDFNRNCYDTHGTPSGDNQNSDLHCDNVNKTIEQISANVKNNEQKVNLDVVRPRSFAAVLKSTSENSLDKQTSPETGQTIDKLPNKVIRGIKENISPENTLTSSMTNTKALAQELIETKQIKPPECNQQIVNALWDVSSPVLDKIEPNANDFKAQSEIETAIARIETCFNDDLTNTSIYEKPQLDYAEVDSKIDEKDTSIDSKVTLERNNDENTKKITDYIDLGKDALAFLVYENQDFEPDMELMAESENKNNDKGTVLAEELRDAELKQKLIDLSPELVVDESVEVPEIFTAKEIKGLKTPPVIPERAKLKKSNSLEELSERLQRIDLEEDGESGSKRSKIIFKVPESLGSTPKDIPETRRHRLRTRSGSSPKSLPESLIKPSPINKQDAPKKKKKVSSLGKMARDSLLALNMSEEEIAEFRRSYKLTSVESLRSLESVSEDANSQSGNSMDSRCRVCLRTSQESLMSLDSISEDCRCGNNELCEEGAHSAR